MVIVTYIYICYIYIYIYIYISPSGSVSKQSFLLRLLGPEPVLPEDPLPALCAWVTDERIRLRASCMSSGALGSGFWGFGVWGLGFLLQASVTFMQPLRGSPLEAHISA